MILTEYDEQAHIKNEKEISYEEGKAEGEEALAKLIRCLQADGRIEDANKVLSDKEYRKQLKREYNIF